MAFEESPKSDGYQEKLVSVTRTAKVVKVAVYSVLLF